MLQVITVCFLRLSSKVTISKVELCKIKICFLENWHFWNFRTSIFSKSVYFLILNNFFKNGSPGQTTMLMRRAAKFWVEPRSPFSEIFYQESKTIGKPPNIVSWPECQPEFPSDGGVGVPTTLSIWSGPGSITPRNQISRSGGIPHFDDLIWNVQSINELLSILKLEQTINIS